MIKIELEFTTETAKFLNLEWNDALVHHEEHIGSDISLSSLERSTDQVVKALYTSGTFSNFFLTQNYF